MFAIRNWESHYDLKAAKGALELWFTIEIAGPPSGTYPVEVDFIWPSGSATRVPKTFAIPFNTGRSQIDLKAHIDNVKAGNYALRLTVGGEQLDDIAFTVRGGPRIKRIVAKAKVVETGKLLASVLTQDDMHGDTGFLSFETIPTELPSEVEIARRFADLCREHNDGRNLRDCTSGAPFPDVRCTDAVTDATVTLELTQLAYEGWQTIQSHARRLKGALHSVLVSHRPNYRARAMILYFNLHERRPLIPNPRTNHGKAFLRELNQALQTGLWVVRQLPPGDSGKPLQLETLQAPPALSVFHHYLRKIELGPNDPSDPRLLSRDDPLLLLHAEKVVEEGEFARLVAEAVNRKLMRGTAYAADILLIHNAVDPHVLVAAEDDDPVDLARDVVAGTNVGARFGEVWLFDVWEDSIWKLS